MKDKFLIISTMNFTLALIHAGAGNSLFMVMNLVGGILGYVCWKGEQA